MIMLYKVRKLPLGTDPFTPQPGLQS